VDEVAKRYGMKWPKNKIILMNKFKIKKDEFL
jgi:hypothetical protein